MLLMLCVSVMAQSVTLSFTGKDANNNRVQLDHVSITNLTKGWQEIIYWPDTTLTMQNGTSIDDYTNNDGFSLLQNNPNPFSGSTDVLLMVGEVGAITMEITDVNGRLVVGVSDYSLQPGTNQFRVTLSSAGAYVMTARCNGKTSSIKMVNNGSGNVDKIDYVGVGNIPASKSETRGNTNNPFNFGDLMEYVGYATINGTEYESDRITQMQGASQTFALLFAVMQNTTPTVVTLPVSDVSNTSAMVGGNVTSDGGQAVFDRGVCYSMVSMPTISDNCIHIGQGVGSFTDVLSGLLSGSTYYIRAFAINSMGVAYGNEVSFSTTNIPPFICGTSTLTDIDGNVYNTVQIGMQCWMKENLRTTKYSDNTPIDHGNDTSTNVPYWYYPDDNSANKDIYGLLYNWKASMRNSASSSSNPSGVQGVCPEGWHLPSDVEWKLMEISVGMSQSDANNVGSRGNIAARLSGNIGWLPSINENAAGNLYAPGHNSSGFSALPAGIYGLGYGYFGGSAYFWSSTELNSISAYHRVLNSEASDVHRNGSVKYMGCSVRCVRDESGDGQPCYGIPSLIDIDGNFYNTVQIGNQCWMKENLRTTKYVDNTEIPTSTDDFSLPFRCAPNGDESNVSTYGYLYNWAAVMKGSPSSESNPSGVQGICPNGWHLPSNAEWSQLIGYVYCMSQYLCNGSYIGKALSSTIGWDSATGYCEVGNVQSDNNVTGFGAMPGGGCFTNNFSALHQTAYFWSTTEIESNEQQAETFQLWYNRREYGGGGVLKTASFSVRCIKD